MQLGSEMPQPQWEGGTASRSYIMMPQKAALNIIGMVTAESTE